MADRGRRAMWLCAGVAVAAVACGRTSPTGPSTGSGGAGSSSPPPTGPLTPYLLDISRIVVREGFQSGSALAPQPDGTYVVRVQGALTSPAYSIESYGTFANGIVDSARQLEGTLSANYPLGAVFNSIGGGTSPFGGERLMTITSFRGPPAPGDGYTLTVRFVETRPGTDFRNELLRTVRLTAGP